MQLRMRRVRSQLRKQEVINSKSRIKSFQPRGNEVFNPPCNTKQGTRPAYGSGGGVSARLCFCFSCIGGCL